MQKLNINDYSLITFFFMNDTDRKKNRKSKYSALTRLPENDDIHGMEEIWEGINIFLNGLAE